MSKDIEQQIKSTRRATIIRVVINLVIATILIAVIDFLLTRFLCPIVYQAVA